MQPWLNFLFDCNPNFANSHSATWPKYSKGNWRNCQFTRTSISPNALICYSSMNCNAEPSGGSAVSRLSLGIKATRKQSDAAEADDGFGLEVNARW